MKSNKHMMAPSTINIKEKLCFASNTSFYCFLNCEEYCWAVNIEIWLDILSICLVSVFAVIAVAENDVNSGFSAKGVLCFS